MVKRIGRFIRQYAHFSLALTALVIALPLQLAGQETIAHWLLGVTAVISVAPLLWGMWQDLRSGTYGVDILAATAIITAVIMGEYWAALVIVVMLTGGQSLEDYAEHRAASELDALLTKAPQKAHLLKGRKETDVRVSQVEVGNKLVVRPGEVVPVDATILEGSASFDESSLTGESLPQTKQPGDTILSGAVNLDGALVVKALHSASDSQYQQIIKLVRAAQSSRAPFVRLADRYSVPFTVISFAIAGGAWALSGESLRFLQVLVVATPCPLILAAPIAIISGMSRAAKHGIIIKNGGSLERLALAQTFAFDKTGTLTTGELKVDHIKTFHNHKTSELLSLAAGLEQKSNHVLAQAIVAHASDTSVKLAKVKNVRELAGHGLAAEVQGKEVLVGRLSLLTNRNVPLPQGFNPRSVQTTAAYVAIDGTLAGMITFKDSLRQETVPTLQRLHELGIRHLLMVTGDNTATAQTIAKKAGIDDVYAEMLPGDKMQVVEQAQSRPVAFVGDGVNDAPVLTASDVGIALGARGSTAASESADVVVMLDDLGRVARAVEIAKRTFFIAKQSILVGIALSIGLMVLFATGKFSPLYGALLQEVVDVVVIFNALRAHGRLTRG